MSGRTNRDQDRLFFVEVIKKSFKKVVRRIRLVSKSFVGIRVVSLNEIASPWGLR